MMADAVQMNQVYRKQVESIGGEFVDIWDGFVSEKRVTSSSPAPISTSAGVLRAPPTAST